MTAPTGRGESGYRAERERLPCSVYRLLLHAYPASFRAAFGGEMLLLFRDQLRDHRLADPGHATTGGTRSPGGAAARFWLTVLWDVTRSAPALRLNAVRETLRGRGRDSAHAALDRPPSGGLHIPSEGPTMTAKRAVAMLAVLGGAFELANAGVETISGWGAGLGGDWQLSVVLSLLMGALLLGAGTAMLRGRIGAARGAALGCLALVVVLQLAYPYMSLFSRLLGVAIPVALLLVARRHDSGRSMPSMA